MRAIIKVLSDVITDDNIKMALQAIVWASGMIDLPPGYGHEVGFVNPAMKFEFQKMRGIS
jgi:hypothetical protein